MSEKSRADEISDSAGAGPETPAPLIGQEEWEEAIKQLLATNPQAAGMFAAWLLELKDELESGPEGAARTVESLRVAIQRVAGLSSKYEC